eukprot:m.111164 g.111164  ORF g.111164 m.111164 type:complete len:54 (+) comp13435_c0_seq1:636-797(+)
MRSGLMSAQSAHPPKSAVPSVNGWAASITLIRTSAPCYFVFSTFLSPFYSVLL